MGDSPIFPGNSAFPLTPDGQWRGEWFRYLRDLAKQPRISTDQSAAILALAERVEALEEGEGDFASIQGLLSVLVSGTLEGGLVQIELAGDEATPAASSYYGTDDTGAKGWFSRLLATLNDVDLAGLANGDTLVWNATTEKFEPGQPAQPSMFPIVTGEVPPVFVCGPDGSLVYGPVH